MAILVTVLLMTVWGSTFLVTKTTVREIPPFTLGVARFLMAGAILAPLALARGALARAPRPFPWKALLLLALTGIAGFSAAFNNAMRYGSVSQNAIIFSMVPAAIAVAAVLILKEKLTGLRILGITFSVTGVALVVAVGRSNPSAPNPMLGALCMLAGVVAWALYTVLAKRLAHVDPTLVITGAALLGALMLLPLAGLELAHTGIPHVSAGGWAGALFLGIIASGVAYAVYSRVLRELDASLVGTLLNLDPIVGVLTAVVFLGETLHGWQIAGGILALAGMWLASRDGGETGQQGRNPATVPGS